MMTIEEAVKARHAVRSYTDRPIEQEKIDELQKLVDDFNGRSGLHIQLITNDPKAFDSRLARYGKFSGVRNYFAMIGQKAPLLDETIGYFGEQLVIKAQQLGLNTCWVGMTFKKNPDVLKMSGDDKLRCVIAVGYGTTQGVSHKVKNFEQVAKNYSTMPKWFKLGVAYALLAPTAVNQQKFKFRLLPDNRVQVKAGFGFFSKVDLGIVKCHFEIGAGTENFSWA